MAIFFLLMRKRNDGCAQMNTLRERIDDAAASVQRVFYEGLPAEHFVPPVTEGGEKRASGPVQDLQTATELEVGPEQQISPGSRICAMV